MSVTTTWKKVLTPVLDKLPGEQLAVNYFCAAVGCPTNFGDPERRTALSTNFISWACWVFEHYEQVHGRTEKWVYDDLNTLVAARWVR